MVDMDAVILLRGAGDIASGVAARLVRCGFRLVMTEVLQPMAVRRKVAFSEAIYNGSTQVEGLTARRVDTSDECEAVINKGEIPILVDEALGLLKKPAQRVAALIDARMLKTSPNEKYLDHPFLSIGVGPGFSAGQDCHVVIESNRGHSMGRIIRAGSASSDTGVPAGETDRILRAPADGRLEAFADIGDILVKDQLIATVAGQQVLAPFSGLLRGLIHPGLMVFRRMKIGDMDRSQDASLCTLISDKALAIGGSILEVILTDTVLRPAPGSIRS